MNRVGLLAICVVVLSLSGVASVGYITLQLANIPDKIFFVSVITAFLAPTLTALLAIMRTEALNRVVTKHFEEPRKKSRT